MAKWRDTIYVERIREQNSPEESFRQDGSSVTRTFDVAWDDRADAVVDFLGFPYISGGILRRLIPIYYDQYENSSGDPFLFATQVTRLEGIGVPTDRDVKDNDATGGTARYEKARITLLFETLTYDVKDDNAIPQTNGGPDESSLQRYVTKVVKPNADYLNLPPTAGNTLKWVNDGGPYQGKPINFNIGKILPCYDVSLTWHQVPKEAVGSHLINAGLTNPWIDNALGKVNCSDFAGVTAGTLLLLAADIRPIRSPFGDRLFDIEYRMKHRVSTHHAFFVPDITTGGFHEISSDGNPYPEGGFPQIKKHIYDSVEFANLFRVAA